MNKSSMGYSRNMFLVIFCIMSLNAGKTAVAAKEVTAKAGPVLHKITGLAIVSEIPENWTIKRFKNIAKSKPAPTGHVWYVLKGTATNNGSDARSIDINSYKIIDKSGNEYKADVKNTIYQPEGTGIAYNNIEPGQTKTWLAFFPVPATAQGLKLRATDLKLFPDKVARITLPNPNVSPAKPSEGSKAVKAASAKTVRTKEEPKAATTLATKKPAARKDGINLQKVKSAEMGFEILIPEGAKTLQKSKWAITYSLVLKDRINEININLTLMSANNLDDLANTATMTGGKEILEKKSVENGFLVVKKGRGSLIVVWLSRKGKKESVTVKVTVPDTYKAIALEIAKSLKVTK